MEPTGQKKQASRLMRWKVSELRHDKRTGPLTCVPMSDYAKELVQAMMRKWK